MLPNPLETADLVTFTEEILNRKLRSIEVKSNIGFKWVHENFGVAEQCLNKLINSPLPAGIQ